MLVRRVTAVLASLTLAGGVALTGATSAAAHPTQLSTTSGTLGTRSLAAVLAADGSGFDRTWRDYDILDNAVHAVLAAKPGSPVGVLANGTVPLTAFLPSDLAFLRLAHRLTGTWYTSESAVFADVAKLGVSTIEAVLLYHVVPGATISYRAALRSNHATLTMASGGTVRVNVLYGIFVRLIDTNPATPAAWVIAPDINAGNRQIAHGISQVLLP